MKRARNFFAVLVLLFGFASAGAGAQQITRIAVIDLQRVLATIPRDPVALRDFEQKKAEIQAEVDRMGDEIKRLQAQKAEADGAGNKTVSARLESEIAAKTVELRDYVRIRQPQLDDLAKKVTLSSAVTQQLYRQIQTIAESDGFSVVLNIKGGDSLGNPVLWYSPDVDITDRVVKALSARTP